MSHVTVRDLFLMLARHWRGALAILLLVVLGTALGTMQQTPVYESRTTIYFAATDADGQSTGNLYQMPGGERSTLTRIARSPLILDPVRETLGLDGSVPISVDASSGGEDTALFDFVVRSDSPEHASQVAREVPVELARNARSYAPTLAQSGAQVAAQFVDEPTRSSTPVAPDPVRNLMIAGLAGLMLGVAYAVGRGSLDTRLRNPADLERVSDRPVLSTIPLLSGKRSERNLYVVDDPHGPQAEAVRKLRTNLVFVDVAGKNAHSFVITSAMPGEGKTTTVVNLALAVAESERRVLVIDADLRRPTVAEKLGLEGSVGLTTVLAGEAEPRDVIQRWGDTQLYVLSGGQIPPNPSELLGSKAMENLFYRLADEFDFVLVDSPPVLPVTDSLVLSKLTGGLVMVISTATRRRHLQEALRTLGTGDAHVDGFVLTKTPAEKDGSYYYRYQGPDSAKPASRRARSEEGRPRRMVGARSARR